MISIITTNTASIWCVGIILILSIKYLYLLLLIKPPKPYQGPAAMMGFSQLIPSEHDMIGCLSSISVFVWTVACLAFWVGKHI